MKIKDSGNRTEFESGAVRDIQGGKGRFDLVPLDVMSYYFRDNDFINGVLFYINKFRILSDTDCLFRAMEIFNQQCWNSHITMFLEVAKHFEEGSAKYGEHNWQKGIPVHSFIDSAIRHYMKWLRGDKDEPHDRAFVWNIMCAVWTMWNKPELDDFTEREEE